MYHKIQPNVGIYTSPMDPMGYLKRPSGHDILSFSRSPPSALASRFGLGCQEAAIEAFSGGAWKNTQWSWKYMDDDMIIYAMYMLYIP